MKRADAPSMDAAHGEWRPNDMRLWTKDELIAEIGRLEAWTDDRESLVAEVARLAQYSDALEDQATMLKAEVARLRAAWQTQQTLLVQTEAERKRICDHAEDVVLGMVREFDAVMGRDAVASGYYQHAIDFLKVCEQDATGSGAFREERRQP